MKISLFLLLFLSACAGSKIKPTPAVPLVVAPPAAAATDPSGLITAMPFILHDNRMLVNVFLNGQGPFVMIFDTGAQNILTPEVQRILDLKSQGPEVVHSSEHKAAANTVRLKSVQLGAYKLQDQRFGVVNLSSIRKTFHFPHLDGIIGFGLMQQVKVRLDFDINQVELFDEAAPALAAAQLLKFEWLNDKPLIDGKINGQPAHILIDTGDRSNLTLFRKFAVSTKLADIFANRGEILTGMGLSGPIRGKVASLQSIDLGPTEVTDVLARLPMTKKGYFFSKQISASAGIGLLKNFNLEFDSKRQTLALSKRATTEDSTFVPVPLPRTRR